MEILPNAACESGVLILACSPNLVESSLLKTRPPTGTVGLWGSGWRLAAARRKIELARVMAAGPMAGADFAQLRLFLGAALMVVEWAARVEFAAGGES